MFQGVPGFLEGVPGCSGFFTLFRVFLGVLVFLELLHAPDWSVFLDLHARVFASRL